MFPSILPQDSTATGSHSFVVAMPLKIVLGTLALIVLALILRELRRVPAKLHVLMFTAFLDMAGTLMVIPLMPFYAARLGAGGLVFFLRHATTGVSGRIATMIARLLPIVDRCAIAASPGRVSRNRTGRRETLRSGRESHRFRSSDRCRSPRSRRVLAITLRRVGE